MSSPPSTFPATITEDLDYAHPMILSTTSRKTVRRFLVEGISGQPGALQPYLAIVAEDSSNGITIPTLLQAHPYDSNSLAESIEPRSLGGGKWEVLVTYEARLYPSNYLEEFHASFQEVPTHYDASNNLATITYTPTGSSSSVKDVASLKRLSLQATVTYNVLETRNPRNLTIQYAGYVNSDTWLGSSPRTWLCLPICGSTKDNVWFHNRYSFAYRAETWDEYAFFRDSHGHVPEDIAATLVTDGSSMSGNGWGRFIMQPQMAFGTTFPDFTT
jgi:hypothetical protein